MSQRQLASVLFTVLGIFVAVTRLPQIVLQLGLWAQSSGASAGPTDAYSAALSITLLISTVMAVLLGIGLVLLRNPLAERLFPVDTPPLAARETQAVALSVLGCYFVIESMRRLVWLGRVDWSAVAQLVLGLGLFLGARGVARFWAFARSAGSSGDNERAV